MYLLFLLLLVVAVVVVALAGEDLAATVDPDGSGNGGGSDGCMGVVPTRPPHAAVLLEPRNLPTLTLVIQNVLDTLPANLFEVVILHGDQNSARLREHFSDHPRVRLHQLIEGNMTRQDYNRLVKDRTLYEEEHGVLGQFDGLLFFQADTVLCGTGTDVADFLPYGYVGAPWGARVGRGNGFACACLRDQSLPRFRVRVGNGGLSLRRRKSVLAVIDRWGPVSGHMPFNEDVWFACGVAALSEHSGEPGDDNYSPNPLAPVEIARRFAVESIPVSAAADSSQPPFGVHKPWKFLSKPEMQTLVSMCPPLEELLARGHWPLGNTNDDDENGPDG